MSNGDYIRAMDDNRLVNFLYTLKLNTAKEKIQCLLQMGEEERMVEWE